MSEDRFTLEGRIAVISGASRGIGEAIAQGFAEHGATVILAARKLEALETAASTIASKGGNARAIACHTGKCDQIHSLFDQVEQEFGHVDILVNNAATNPHFGPAIDVTEAAFDKTFEVNTKGYFMMAQRAARTMMERRSGSIINIASVVGLTAFPNQGIYGMTKAAVIYMTRMLASEWGPQGIRCNCIAPGLVETRFASLLVETDEHHKVFTDRAALGRHAQPSELVGAAIYLASDASSYTTGAILNCDGGTLT
ncbi:MAG: short-chain dehydrogenase [Phycisphaerae bacterium]|nr:MAG: short-chain dehydrogenase [Phycisphaerae bacterium]